MLPCERSNPPGPIPATAPRPPAKRSSTRPMRATEATRSKSPTAPTPKRSRPRPALNFIGAGDEATVVRGPDGSGAAGHPAFVLPNGGSLSSLSAEGGNGARRRPERLRRRLRDRLRTERARSGRAGPRSGGRRQGAMAAPAPVPASAAPAVAPSSRLRPKAEDRHRGRFDPGLRRRGRRSPPTSAVAISGDAMSGEFVNSEIEAATRLHRHRARRPLKVASASIVRRQLSRGGSSARAPKEAS